ncbi:DUF2336 domain-containing protein [Stappia sp. F7233]|uniref:DUF2336 domain-containing protein n=1 Tax=Stappia albiluteola TaxID=2758565 RepID=A0A839ADT1_9HYPH|nr:DUF2336 domain-containing protein [Stappia albiluteola]MBA5777843.1 DUF2336 domain-containing protein [Stappia albiluteola]
MNLAQLSDLARNHSRDGRAALAKALTDLFVAANDDEAGSVSDLYGEIICKVIDTLACPARRDIADRVGSHSVAPRKLLRVLANDEFDVAEPVLRNAVVLTDADLVEVAESGTQDHLKAIAMRQTVDPAVSRVVAERGEAEVLVAILRNFGASFSGDTFNHLATQARRNPELQEALCDRSDLTRQAAELLVPFLSAELEHRVRRQRKNQTVLRALSERPLHKVNVQLHDLGDAPSRTQQLIDSVVAGKTSIDEAVELFTSKNKTIDLGNLISQVAKVPEAAVLRMLFREQDQPLIMLCRVAGVSEKAYEKIAGMRAKRLKMTAAAISDAVERYASMDRATAQKLLEESRSKVKGAA